MLFTRGVVRIELWICLEEGVNNGASSRCENIAKVAGTRMELDMRLDNNIYENNLTYHSKDRAVRPNFDRILLE